MTQVGSTFVEYMPTPARADLIFSGGRPATTETFVLNGVTFEYLIGTNASLDDDLVWLAALVNASTDAAIAGVITATALPTGTATELRFTADKPGNDGNALTLTEGLSNCTKSGATFSGGTSHANEEIFIAPHVVDASDATLDSIVFVTPFAKIMTFSSTLHDAGILDVTNQPVYAVSGGTLTMTSGAQTWAAGDILTVTISGYTVAKTDA
jgi:hypothetical protein